MTATSFRIAMNTASAVINEVNAIMLYVGSKNLYLPETNQETKERIS